MLEHLRFALPLLVSVSVACGGQTPQPSSPSGEGEGESPAVESEGDASTPPKTSIKTLYVRDVLADCEGESPRKCMQVRETPEGEWTFFYDSIEGFDYEETYQYELRVEVKPVADPPADGSSLRYRLVQVVSKTKVPSGS